MTMVIYGTFCGFENVENEVSQFKWEKIADGLGNKVKSIYLSENETIFNRTRLKFGDRFMLVCDEVKSNKLVNISKIKLVNKNPKCGIFRKFRDEFHMIRGKYQGKRDIDIPDDELARYCIWLAENTNNEATISNTLQILEKIKNKL
jgi:uncharacterized protein (DUF3820 family)